MLRRETVAVNKFVYILYTLYTMYCEKKERKKKLPKANEQTKREYNIFLKVKAKENWNEIIIFRPELCVQVPNSLHISYYL